MKFPSLSATLLCCYFSALIVGAAADDDHDIEPTVPSNCTTSGHTEIKFKSGNTVIGGVQTQSIDEFTVQALGNQGNLSVDLNRFILSTSGSIYLFPEPVPHDGVIFHIISFGYISQESLVEALSLPPENDFGAYLFAVVFRRDAESGSYQLVHGPEEHSHFIAPAILDVPLTVREGDLVGALIPNYCFNRTASFFRCPSQVNLRADPWDCSYALYYPLNMEEAIDGEEWRSVSIPEDDFVEVQVNLNMEFSISRSTTEDESQKLQYIIPAVLVGILLGALGVGLVLWCFLLGRKRSLRKFSATIGMRDGSRKENTADKKGDIHAVAVDKKESFVTSLGATNHTYEDMLPVVVPLSPDGYSLLGKETSNDSALDGHPGNSRGNGIRFRDSGYEYDYEEPYFEPASEEEALIMQLNTKLAVTEVPREDLELGAILGSGAFGTVYRGVWSHHEADSNRVVKEEVAVKSIDHQINQNDKVKFLQEAAIMAQFKHSNIVRIRGVLTEPPTMMIILDLLEGGDLRQYLLDSVRNRLPSLDPLELSSVLLSYTRQVALGLMYLMQRSYVHRDLAARNILVSRDGMICKISDFGLSRDLQKENFYISHGGKVPVKWTAPEALHYHKYSAASDVWSYGCVLYEIWSLGHKPFQELSNSEAMKYIVSGGRLHPPPGCPKSVYTIMIYCWNPDADERPAISSITQELQRSDYHLLKWSADDISLYSKETRTIGASLDLGKELFEDLQNTYVAKPFR